MRTSLNSLAHIFANFSVKGQMGNNLAFVGHIVPHATIQPGMKAALYSV